MNVTFSAFFVFRLSKFYQQRKLFKYSGDGSAFKNETKREVPEEEVTKSFVNNLMVSNSKNGNIQIVFNEIGYVHSSSKIRN